VDPLAWKRPIDGHVRCAGLKNPHDCGKRRACLLNQEANGILSAALMIDDRMRHLVGGAIELGVADRLRLALDGRSIRVARHDAAEASRDGVGEFDCLERHEGV